MRKAVCWYTHGNLATDLYFQNIYDHIPCVLIIIVAHKTTSIQSVAIFATLVCWKIKALEIMVNACRRKKKA